MFLMHISTSASLAACLLAMLIPRASAIDCLRQSEGSCRERSEPTIVEICASGIWQQIEQGPYECRSGVMVPSSPFYNFSATTSYATSHTVASMAIATRGPQSQLSLAGTTGYAHCTGIRPPYGSSPHGRACYRTGGKMASTYDATPSSSFRCNTTPPFDGYYVAFWTRYQSNQISQPQPMNCNQTVVLTNPQLGRTATAVVIDRCASCVGVGRQLDDPTTPDCLVNGATVDLSRALWNYLYDNAPPSVYDIEYSGAVYPGWTDEPSPLTDLTSAECKCS